MANSYNVQTLLDGPRWAVFKVDIQLDGLSGDFGNPQTIVNLPALSSMGPTYGLHPKKVRVDILDWDAQDGLSVFLWWDGVGPTPLWRMVGRSIEKAYHIGGLQNNADQPNGNITMTTQSVQQAPLVATFKIHCVKQS